MRISALCIVLALLSGCVALTSMETGRAIGSGQEALRVSASSGVFSEISIDGDRDDVSDEPLPLDFVPVVGAGYTFGIGPRTDLGVQADMAGFASVRVKHQVVGSAASPVAVALGAEAGTHVGALLFGFGYVVGSATATASVHPRPGVAVFASSRHTVVAVEPLSPPPESSRTQGSGWSFPSVTYGVAVGRQRQVGVEVTHAGLGAPSQVSVGYRFRLP